jgi:hypothetical protein
MQKEERLDWPATIERILKDTKITEDDFRKKGATSVIHSKILESLEDRWMRSKAPVLEERGFQIDFVGRSFARHGKIELAVEVDTGFKPTGNWVKLLDISAKDKVWIYVCRQREKAESNLETALTEFRRLARLRHEDKANNVTIFMKVSGETGPVQKHTLFT